MLRLCLIVVTVAALAVPVTLPRPALAANKEAKIAAGAALGIALGAIIAAKRKNRNQPRINYGPSFSPARGIVCYPQYQQCYRGSYYANDWTYRVYGY